MELVAVNQLYIELWKEGQPSLTYYASEIKPEAIKVTQSNFPETIQLGDVTKIDFKQFEGQIDLNTTFVKHH